MDGISWWEGVIYLAILLVAGMVVVAVVAALVAVIVMAILRIFRLR